MGRRLVLGLGLLLLLPFAARADEKARPAPKAEGGAIEVTVTVIHATETGPAEVDPGLERFAEVFRKGRFASYKRFKRLDAHTLRLAGDAATRATLPEGRELLLTQQGTHDGLIHLQLKLDGTFVYKVKDGGWFVHVVAPFAGGALVLPIEARAATTR